MAEGGAEKQKPPDMGDLLEYFEARSRSLDEEGQPCLDTSTLQFISLIKFNGVSILPPVLSRARREEMQLYKREALRKDTRVRARNREEMHAKVQSIVAGVEERRAAKQASTSKSSSRSAPTSEVITRLSTSSSKSVFSDTSRTMPSEIVINVSSSPTAAQSPSSAKSAQSSSSSPKPSAKTTSAAGRKSSPSKSSSPGTPTKSPSKSTHSSYKSLGKLGGLSKQKSFSTQNLERSGFSKTETDSLQSQENDPSSLSPKSRALFPHPPHGRPPSRGSPMRQSASTPDLRTIDFSIQKDDLTKPLAKVSSKVYGGRPQTSNEEEEKSENSKLKSKLSLKAEELKTKLNKPKNESIKNNSSPSKDVRKVEKEKVQDVGTGAIKKSIREDNKMKVEREKPSVKPKPANLKLQNPLEVLEQELTREVEMESRSKYGSDKTGAHRLEVRRELDPIQAAAAQLFPFPITEEQALATLDSLQSDFQSMDQIDSLPKDYNGIPLNSLKEQQIIHMLTKLSTALNIEDTLTSTSGSNASGEPARDTRQDQWKGQMSKQPSDSRSVQYGASGRGGYTAGEPMDIGEDSVNVTNDSSTTGVSSVSANSSHSRARMSPTGSSILSTGSSVSGSRQRMSPKSLKNTVHFSSMVTEISTSASQSYEDKISYRKLDITPKSSENFDDEHGSAVDSRSSVVNSGSTQSTGQPNTSLLNKVHLSPSVDSSAGSPGEMRGNGFPFDHSFPDGELNTSDKENEYVAHDTESSDENYQNEMPGRSGRNQHVLNVYMANIPQGPIGENHPAVVKASVRSDGSETSTLKASQDKMLLQENLAMYNQDLQYCYGPELDRYRYGSGTTNSSTTSMQEEITRSYILAEQNLQNRGREDKFEVRKPGKKNTKKSFDLDESHILLQPIIYHNTTDSLQHNRSMLDEEERIRTNLQRVELHDSEEEHSDSDNDSKEESEAENIEVKRTEVDDESEEDDDQDTSMKLQSVDEVHDQNVHNEIEMPINEDMTHESLDKPEEVITVNEEPHTAYVELSDNHPGGNNSDENQIHDSGAQTNINHDNIEQTEREHPQVTVTEHDEDEEADHEPEVTELQGNTVIEENKGKAEHIQKYLTQVHEHSLHQEDFPDDEEDDTATDQMDANSAPGLDVGAMIHTFSSTIQSMNHLSQEELFKVQEEQFELLQQKLIEQQRQQLEELFVVQRRQQLKMQQELEFFQQKAKSREFQSIPSQDFAPNFSTHSDYSALSNPYEAQTGYLANQPAYNSQTNGARCGQDTSLMSESVTRDQIETMQLPATLQPQMSDQLPHVTQAWQSVPANMTADMSHISQTSARSPPFPVQPVAPASYYSNPLTSSYNSSYMVPSFPNPSGVYPDPRMFPGVRGCPVLQATPFMGPGVGPDDPNLSHISHNTSYSTIPMDPGMVHNAAMGPPPPPPSQPMKTISKQKNRTTSQQNTFAYPQSPSLYQGGKERDDASEVSGFAQATPKQLVFSNQSTPVMPRTQPVYRPILHSPQKKVGNYHNQSGTITCPQKVFDPSMQPKFARVSAAVKGYLTRRLLRTQKVKDIIKTIDDTRNFAFSFQAETPIKTGTFSRDDRILLERIVNQLQAALLDIHEVFFEMSITERMAIISKSRQLEEDRRLRESQATSRSGGLSRSQSRLSQATLKAMERKRQAQIAESAVFGSCEFRPKSAPPSTSSPQSTTDVRALRPIQSHISPIHPDNQVTVREMKERPKSAGDKIRTTGSGSQRSKKTGSKSSKPAGSTVSKPLVSHNGNTKPSSATSSVSQGTRKPSTHTAAKGPSAPGKQKGVTGLQPGRSRKSADKTWR